MECRSAAIVVFMALVAGAAVSRAAEPEVAPAAALAAAVKEFQLQESSQPVRETMRGWAAPRKIVVAVDEPGRTAWLQQAMPKGVTVVGVPNEEGAGPQLADADALVEAGAFAIVLELVTPPVAQELSQRISIPTIGIGAGPDCDGQILVTPDLLGMLPWYSLKHVKPKLNAAEQMRSVVADWKKGVETTKLPKPVGSSVPL